MQLPTFKLEEFMKKYEFSTPLMLCCSETESWKLKDLIKLADPETKELWDHLSLGYTESPGLPLLRKEIARLYANIDEEHVLTFAGAEEGIYCSIQGIVKPGDHVIVVDPCYQSLASLPISFGADVTKITLDPRKGWQLELADLKKAMRPNTKLILFNYPHNPTGTLLSKEVFEGVIELARKCGAYIFCDEVYRYLEIDERDRLPSFAEAYEKGVTLNVMTKSFGLAGLRIGWLASQDDDFLQKAGSYKLYTSICNSAPSEILALIGLRAKEQILKRSRDIVLGNYRLLVDFMKRHEKILSWVPPQSGTIAIIELLLPIPVEKFHQDLVDEMGVLIMPGTIFDIPGNFFRVGFGKKNMAAALNRFEQFLKRYL